MKLIKKLYCNINYLTISTEILIFNVIPIILSGVITKYFSISIQLAALIIVWLLGVTNLLALCQMIFPWFPVRIFPEAEAKDVSMNRKLIINSMVVIGGIMLLEYKFL